MMLGGARISAGARPPEDKSLFPKAGVQDFSGSAKLEKRSSDGGEKAAKARKSKDFETRAARLVMNDLENIPLGLIVAWMGVLCGGNRWIHLASLWAFCLGRLVHSYCYAKAIQPWRAISWGVAFGATFITGGNALIAVL
eukprot:FR744325.1.p1 GENE.FR744325.1~~FR744325.1.p1  ORF type:complete len:157 (+),score=17.96 FR744325.1:54-473(+)